MDVGPTYQPIRQLHHQDIYIYAFKLCFCNFLSPVCILFFFLSLSLAAPSFSLIHNLVTLFLQLLIAELPRNYNGLRLSHSYFKENRKLSTLKLSEFLLFNCPASDGKKIYSASPGFISFERCCHQSHIQMMGLIKLAFLELISKKINNYPHCLQGVTGIKSTHTCTIFL